MTKCPVQSNIRRGPVFRGLVPREVRSKKKNDSVISRDHCCDLKMSRRRGDRHL